MLVNLKIIETEIIMDKVEKSTVKSNICRKIGDGLILESHYYDALKFYNKSLCFAVSSEEASLAYGNRSAVYFELNLYQHCLDNIELAMPDYPQDEVAKLIERQEKCRKIMSENESLDSPSYKAIKDMIKLSYPANPKIPYIVDCLEMKTGAVFGRGIYTTRDLNPGDIIAVEDIRVTYIVDGNYERCCICMKTNNLDLHSADENAELMVCSMECKEKKDILQTFNESSEFSFDKIVMDLGLPEISHCDAIKANTRQLKTIFDYDWSNLTGNEYKLAYLECFYGLSSHQSAVDKNNQLEHFISCMIKILQSSKILLNYCDVRNDGKMSQIHAEGYLLFGSLLNHSCEPNVLKFEFERSMIFYVARSIKKGEQLFLSYFGSTLFAKTRDERCLALDQKFHFDCQCSACTAYNSPWLDDDDYILNVNGKMSIEELIQEFNENNEILKNDSENHRTRNTCLIMSRNYFLTQLISSYAILPFNF